MGPTRGRRPVGIEAAAARRNSAAFAAWQRAHDEARSGVACWLCENGAAPGEAVNAYQALRGLERARLAAAAQLEAAEGSREHAVADLDAALVATVERGAPLPDGFEVVAAQRAVEAARGVCDRLSGGPLARQVGDRWAVAYIALNDQAGELLAAVRAVDRAGGDDVAVWLEDELAYQWAGVSQPSEGLWWLPARA
jgi:hypothetical protein